MVRFPIFLYNKAVSRFSKKVPEPTEEEDFEIVPNGGATEEAILNSALPANPNAEAKKRNVKERVK